LLATIGCSGIETLEKETLKFIIPLPRNSSLIDYRVLRTQYKYQNELALEGWMFINMIALKWYYVILNKLKKH